MTYRERYQSEPTWHGRATVMELFHLIQFKSHKKWTISKTAQYFGVSIGLVSENLRLANAMHSNPTIIDIPFRQEALKKLGNK